MISFTPPIFLYAYCSRQVATLGRQIHVIPPLLKQNRDDSRRYLVEVCATEIDACLPNHLAVGRGFKFQHTFLSAKYYFDLILLIIKYLSEDIFLSKHLEVDVGEVNADISDRPDH